MWWSRSIYTLFSLLIVPHFCHGSIYYSLTKMEEVLTSEKFLINKLHSYLDDNEAAMDYDELESFVERAEEENEKARSNPKFMNNPINIFFTITRLAKDWDDVISKYFNEGQEIFDANACTDESNNCQFWADSGECKKNPAYMKVYCQKSCNHCQEGKKCEDLEALCNHWATNGECIKNPNYMLEYCRFSCGVCKVAVELPEDLISTPEGRILSIYRALKLTQTPSNWPLARDFQGVAVGLARLINTYQLDLDELIQGRIHGRQARPFDVTSLYRLADGVRRGGDLYMASQLFEVLLEQLEDQTDHSSDLISRQRVVQDLAETYSSMNHPNLAVEVINQWRNKSRDNETLLDLQERYQAELDRFPSVQLFKEPQKQTAAHPQYEELCRGEQLKSVSERSALYCRYRTSSIPYKPTKEELVNLDPQIVLFHDVITSSEIERVKDVAKGKLKESTVASHDGGDLLSNVRISMSSFLQETDDPVLKRLNTRVREITGLSTRETADPMHVEALQVLNYGIGGMYEPHHDYFHGTNSSFYMVDVTGDRVATFMFYLNEVELGGWTVFPQLRTAVPVTRGGAAFWYNLDEYGEPDSRTQHAGCPVLIGSKWVANKWTREVGQLLTRPCPLTPPVSYNPPPPF